MRILIVTDAWLPQVNGVVRTLTMVAAELEAMGHSVGFITPEGFRTVACPTYPEIRLALANQITVAKRIREFEPDAIHIATEGPLGMAVRWHCMLRRLPFTTSYCTHFPQYIEQRMFVPQAVTFALIRRFHAPSAGVLVSTATLMSELRKRGFDNLRRWSRGVDTTLFKPRPEIYKHATLPGEGPHYLYVGRVAPEKNLDAFLKLELPGTKVVVGGGPQLKELKSRYPKAYFTGALHGETLARHYAAADVFVFPSKSDTYGLVMLEALAAGTPVAAYPVPGPLDVVGRDGGRKQGGQVACLYQDLGLAIEGALKLDPQHCRNFALKHSWRNCAAQFLAHLQPFGVDLAPAA